MSANRDREMSLVPPGYGRVAANVRRLAAAMLAAIPPDPPDVIAQRRADLHTVGGNGTNQHPPDRDRITEERLEPVLIRGVWRWVKVPVTTSPDEDHAARLLAGVTRTPKETR